MDTYERALYSLLKKFRALNFRGLGQQRNFFNNEKFPINGIYLLYIIIYIYICHASGPAKDPFKCATRKRRTGQ